MAFATMDFPVSQGETRKRNVFRRMFDALVEARMLEAERLVRMHLSSMDDQTLERLGYNPATLRKKSGAVRL